MVCPFHQFRIQPGQGDSSKIWSGTEIYAHFCSSPPTGNSSHFVLRVSITVVMTSESFLSTLIWMKFSGAAGGSRVSNWDCSNSGGMKCPCLLHKRSEMTSKEPLRCTTKSRTLADFSSFDSPQFGGTLSSPLIRMSLYTFFRAEQARTTRCPDAVSLSKMSCKLQSHGLLSCPSGDKV